TVVKLGLNYRSTPQVIAVADRLIRHGEGRVPIEFRALAQDGEEPRCVKFPNPEAEAESIAESIRNTMRSGTHPRDMAIFYRTIDTSRLVEQALARRQIPYLVVGSGSYYGRMEVKDVLSMLRFVCTPRDGISFHRIANKPARGMGDTLIGRIETFAERHNTDVLTALARAHEIRDDQGKPLSEAQLAACREVGRIFALPPRASVADVAEALFYRSRYDEWLKARYD